MIRLGKHASIVLAISTVIGCAVEPDEELSTVTQEDRCPWYVCGNSGEVGYRGVWEASIWGAPDINGVSLRRTKTGSAAIYKDGISYSLGVNNGRIFGSHLYYGTISGKNLIGARLSLLQYGYAYYDIWITGVRPAGEGIAFAVGAPDPIETYTMVRTRPGEPASYGKPFCNEQLPYTSDNKVFVFDGMLNNELVVFEGDRFDSTLKTMSQTVDNNWFNFGCAGHALAKLYINRATVKTQPVQDWAQRQATFKMLVADYCGTRNNVGETFTLTGEPIAWKGGLQPDYPVGATLTEQATGEASLDARWNENGATCVYRPRMQYSTNPRQPIDFPNALQQIQSACPSLPLCWNTDAHDLDGARVISANRHPI